CHYVWFLARISKAGLMKKARRPGNDSVAPISAGCGVSFEISHHRTAGKKIPVTPMKETGTRGGEAFERAKAFCCF
ncbi:hypothetical protein N5C79_07595, partial [Pantoea brenneri]|uniref:hypothetical protein n=1 Tax=Pantoea brenneri TaxID=472694 RepID=UPI002446CC6F